MRIRPAFLALLTTIAALPSDPCPAAESAPTLGILYNSQEAHSIVYNCGPVTGGEITCDFVQTAVRFKTTEVELAGKLLEARKQFASSGAQVSPKECDTYRDLVAILEGRKVAPKPEAMKTLSQASKNDKLRLMKAIVAYCGKPTEENFLALTRFQHDLDRRTCRVSSNSFKQIFRPASGGNTLGAWLVQSKPEGACGTVSLSRFEPVDTAISGSGFTFWRYIARKAITNPNNEFAPGVKCGGFDELPYTYDWQPRELQMSCNYIEFSPI